jgi:spore coat polysaccharide biosynthesis protein SpsF (cytidylyltransferase family)
MDAIIQLRMSSSRLPGKVMLLINNKPLLWYVYQRVKRVKNIHRVFLATSTDKADDVLAAYCYQEQIPLYRGDLEDVLDRYYQLAKQEKMRNIIRITADCPLIDYALIDEMITYYVRSKNRIDYLSNIDPPTFPDGLDCEIFSFAALKTAWEKAKLKHEREHVTVYLRKHPEKFKLYNYSSKQDYSYLRWTVDEKEDFELIKGIYEHFNYSINIKMDDIIKYLDHNRALIEYNKKHTRNAGYKEILE